MPSDIKVKLQHPKWGICELVRVDGMDWIVRFLSDGKQYRFSSFSRKDFKVVENPAMVSSKPTDNISQQTSSKAVPPTRLAEVSHPSLGNGDLIRVEGMKWVVRFPVNGKLYAYPPEGRKHLTIKQDFTSDRRFLNRKDNLETVPISINITAETNAEYLTVDRRIARQTIESLKIGQPPICGEARKLAVGFDEITRIISNLLTDVAKDGGRAMVFKGAYGQGKTFGLRLMEETALEQNYLVMRTEVDATENRLCKPHHVYRDLMKNLRIPGISGRGYEPLVRLIKQVDERLTHATSHLVGAYHKYGARISELFKVSGCKPLAWLLADPNISQKEQLLRMLAGDTNIKIPQARSSHYPPGTTKDWPIFNASTQGDFASYLLSGFSRLGRSVGYQGLIVIFDEMEKWQDLSWQEEEKAGNFLGGLIWGATAEEGKRSLSDEPSCINHSGRSGGFPFTTESPNHIGVAIAMTPRGYPNPEDVWSQYGVMEFAKLPELNDKLVAEYCRKLAPWYIKAYGLESPNGMLDKIANKAVKKWKQAGTYSTRLAVQSAVEAFEDWRNSLIGA